MLIPLQYHTLTVDRAECIERAVRAEIARVALNTRAERCSVCACIARGLDHLAEAAEHRVPHDD